MALRMTGQRLQWRHLSLLGVGAVGAGLLYRGLRRMMDHMQINYALEQREAERASSLFRHNTELAILNRLITPILPPNEAAQVIEGCLKEFCEETDVKAKLVLFTRPIRRIAKCGANVPPEQYWIPDFNRSSALLPIRSSELDFGYLDLGEAILDETDRQFMQTLALSAGIILQNEILLRTNEEKHAVLKAVLDSIYDGITWTDTSGSIIYANKRMGQLFEILPDNLRGQTQKDLFKLLTQVHQKDSVDTVGDIMAKNGAYQLKIRVASGRERILAVSVFPVTTGEGIILGRGYLFRDITKLWEIDKLKGDLISLVSHEFKTPITSITGSVETLLRQDAQWDEEFKQELLQGIHEDIGRIRELVNDWLDLSKLTAGTIGLNKEPVRPQVVVENAVHQLPKHFKHGVTIDNKVPGKLPMIYGDRLRLEQVLANLLTNAIRYNDRTPHIDISAYSDEQFVHIAVADNGIGISRQDLAHIFERMQGTDAGLPRRDGGTGLGLAICKGIMQAHGGDIRVQSAKETGSIFTISIPKFNYSTGDTHEKV
ncbi:MAG: rcsC 4 [Firmicutes bacterium]|nr:rcsC 4 [Bacillota bacterium]